MITAMMRDPYSAVKVARTKYKLLPGWAVPVLVGNLIPDLDEVVAFHAAGEDPLAQMAKLAMGRTPRFKELGVAPQLLATGTELNDLEKAKALADADSAVSRLRQLETALKYAPDKAVEDVAKVIQEGQELIQRGGLDDGGAAPLDELEKFREHAAELFAGPLREDFGDCFNAEETPQVLLKDVRKAGPLFTVPATKGALVTAAPTVLKQALARVDQAAEAIRGAWQPVLPTYATAASYFLNAGFTGEVLFIHVPPKVTAATAARRVIEEVADKKFRCSDIVLLNPLRSAAELLTHWAVYFANEPVVQGVVWAGLKYRNLAHLQEIAQGTELMAGAAAGHFIVTAGTAKVFGIDTPVHAALAARCRHKDNLLNPDGGHYGVLESTFGPHEDKTVFGLEDVDSLAWKDAAKAGLAERGVNTLTSTDGMVHAFWLRSLSKDVQHSQGDAVRGREWIVGTARRFLRRVSPGQCNTAAMKRQVADDLTKVLTSPFTNRAGTCKDGLEVSVEPGESADPREFVIALGMPNLAFVERVTIHAKLLGDD